MKEMQARLKNNATMPRIVDYETAKVAEGAMKRTDTATAQSIRKNHTAQEWVTLNGKRYKLANRFPRQLWAALSSKRKASLARKLAARGLAKQTWLNIAQLLGFDISAPGFVKAARGKVSNLENVAVTRSKGSAAYGVRIENHSPLMRWAKGRAALVAAIAGRRKFFAENLKRGVFDDLRQVAKKYPRLMP